MPQEYQRDETMNPTRHLPGIAPSRLPSLVPGLSVAALLFLSAAAPGQNPTPAPRLGTTPAPLPKYTLAPDTGRRPADKRYLPAMVQEPIISMSIQVVSEKPGAPSVYRSRHFEFQTPVKLGQNAMHEICRTFESTHELVRQLPWGILPMPEGGKPFFSAHLLPTRQEYIAYGGPQWSAGFYSRKDRIFRIPFDQVGLVGKGNDWFLKGSINNNVISHEVTHQMMHEYLDFMPVWLVEGTADYVANLPYNSGRFNLTAALDGLQRMRAKEGAVTQERRGNMLYTRTTRRPNWVGVPELLKFTTSIETANPIDSTAYLPPKPSTGGGPTFTGTGIGVQIMPNTDQLGDRYYSSHMLAYFFMHMDGDGTGLRLKKFFDAIHEERKMWPTYWQAVDEFNAQLALARTKYEAEWAAFKKMPGVRETADGGVIYPSTLTAPTMPDMRCPEPPGKTDPRKVCVKYLKLLLDGRTPEQLDAEVKAAFLKVRYPL